MYNPKALTTCISEGKLPTMGRIIVIITMEYKTLVILNRVYFAQIYATTICESVERIVAPTA